MYICTLTFIHIYIHIYVNWRHAKAVTSIGSSLESDSMTFVTWLCHVCDMTHPYVWPDSSIYVKWLIHICDMTHSRVWHDSVVAVITQSQRVTPSHVWYDSIMCVITSHESSLQCDSQTRVAEKIYFSFSITWSCRFMVWDCTLGNTKSYAWHTSAITMIPFKVTLSPVWHDSFMCVIWLMCVSLSQVPDAFDIDNLARNSFLDQVFLQYTWEQAYSYGVASISRLLKMIGLFCRI